MAAPHRWLDDPEHRLRCTRCDCAFNSECGQGDCPDGIDLSQPVIEVEGTMTGRFQKPDEEE